MNLQGIIFSNIYDEKMGELTKSRTVSSLPFGGRYRQIDFVLSNMVNSDIFHIGIITKYNYRSLMDHLGTYDEWDIGSKNGGLFILPPFGSNSSDGIYRGKLEALCTAVEFMKRSRAEYLVLCDSSVICNIDFKEVLASHIESGKDVTVVTDIEKNPVRERDLIINIKDGKIEDMAFRTVPKKGEYSGTGIYIVNRQYMIDAVTHAASRNLIDFERDFISRRFFKKEISMNVYEIKKTVLRNQDIDSYYANNLALLKESVRKDIFSEEAPVYTKVLNEPPTVYKDGCECNEALIADGCVVAGNVEKSVIFRDVVIEEGARVFKSVVMQGTTVKKGADVSYSIIDKNVTVTEGRQLRGAKNALLIIEKGRTV